MVEDEISSGESAPFLDRSLAGMDAIFESLLPGETFISFAKLQVGDIGIQVLILAPDQIGIGIIIAVRSQLSAFEIVSIFANYLHVLFCSHHHGRQILVILAAGSLGMQDDLMLGIHQGLSVVALDHSMGGGHLDRLIIGEVALDLFPAFPDLGLLFLQKHIQALYLMLQSFQLFQASFHIGAGQDILLDVLRDDLMELGLQLVLFSFQFFESSTPFFGSVGWQLETIQTEVRTA
jgi:hypothetical protein